MTEIFLEINGELPDIDVSMVEQIAAGQADRSEIIVWLSERTTPPS